MKTPLLFLLAVCGTALAATPEDSRIPEPLRPWEGWALWGQDHRACPKPFNAADKPVCIWPSRLALDATSSGATFDFSVEAFSESWVQLPGGSEYWPQDVRSAKGLLPVVERSGRPAVKLPPGNHRLEGRFSWNRIPQKIALPESIGLVALSLEGKPIEFPLWDASGHLWLERNASSGEADKDFLAVKLFAELEDGIPLWLRTEVELIVSGKSREEMLGAVLPAGWKLAAIESPVPVAIDESGRMKAQVRPGKWKVSLTAFRLDNPSEFTFPKDVAPAAPDELVAFRSRPDFRMVEIAGSPSVDVSQIAFPDQWKDLPVYRWDTSVPFRIEERMRGMGLQKPAGLTISREWWLDENGRGLTFRDRLTGKMQEIWRLDASEGQDLGSVRSNGDGQLVTRNPANGAPGVEIRSRDLNLEATGRMERGASLPASGWRTDADSVRVTLNLPPGWRLFALLGADWVQGDWLTSWTLLDLFLLLIFSLAVGKLWGWKQAVLAFVAFGLSYHETGAPRFIWLWLLIPLALLRVVQSGWGHRLLLAAKWILIAVFILIVTPYISQQVQQAIYPQLERVGGRGIAVPQPALAPDFEASSAPAPNEAAAADRKQQATSSYGGRWAKSAPQRQDASNLLYDTKTRIQTGPGVPDWTWRSVAFGWNGPVTASQQVRPVMIPLQLERILTVLRVLLILGLAAALLRFRRPALPTAPGAAILLALLFLTPSAGAQMPDSNMLETLRKRLLETPDAFPGAATISKADLSISGNRLELDTEIQAAADCAVPVPGRLAEWSPIAVMLDGKPASSIRRQDGCLWIPVTTGVHRVKVTGLLPDVSDWEWTFLLKPRLVTINAPEWTISGVSASGVPDQQVFFTKIQKSESPGEAAYDRQDFSTLALVERQIELGLVWQVRTTVRKLAPAGKAVALRIPLLDGENVLSSNAQIREGQIDVRIGAQQDSFSWESELTPRETITLKADASDNRAEKWSLTASPVWNVTISGLAPVFEPGNPALIPVWHPWPGESAQLAISRPEAVPGATVTVEKVSRNVSLGMRQSASSLVLGLRCSLGEDFLITLPQDAEVGSLSLNGNAIPVRMDGRKLIVPLRPGQQTVNVDWKTDRPLAFSSRVEDVALPVGSANIETVLNIPDSRWVLWADGPLRGPAVRFWTVLACSLIAAWLLGSLASSPLKTHEWMLLGIGLTQVPLAAALIVIAWLFFLTWRGSEGFLKLPAWGFNLLQLALICVTASALAVFIAVVAEGLLGNPEMFIAGNGSTRSTLRWYEARCAEALPSPGCLSVSIWWFRILMLGWALWLAAALLRWLRLAWTRFSTGGCFRTSRKPAAVPPPIDPPAQGK